MIVDSLTMIPGNKIVTMKKIKRLEKSFCNLQVGKVRTRAVSLKFGQFLKILDHLHQQQWRDFRLVQTVYLLVKKG